MTSIPLSVREFFTNAWNYQELSPNSERLFTYTPNERQSFRSRRYQPKMSIFQSEEMRSVSMHLLRAKRRVSGAVNACQTMN